MFNILASWRHHWGSTNWKQKFVNIYDTYFVVYMLNILMMYHIGKSEDDPYTNSKYNVLVLKTPCCCWRKDKFRLWESSGDHIKFNTWWFCFWFISRREHVNNIWLMKKFCCDPTTCMHIHMIWEVFWYLHYFFFSIYTEQTINSHTTKYNKNKNR